MRKQLINEDAFRSYLDRTISSEKQVRDCISRCRRVEESEGNLIKHYTNDRGRFLMERLTYSKEDADRELEPKHHITFKGTKGYHSILVGTASLRNAVQHYFYFLREHG
ncbi:hypothetical protein ACFWMP_19435 [Paenibacillus sp. NPDC058367]|uniref:hypothetical protein n=1 Tax=Paenibacillus sp. NPDC058367 TaxID=3346460 RepID=UPI0036661203